MQNVDRLLWKHRNVMAGLPLIFVLLSTRGEYGVDRVIWPLALALAILGVVLRAWARRHCAYGQRRPMRLTTSGPYACVRNPLYIGNLLIIMGAAVASELVWATPLILMWAFFVYDRVAQHEERGMIAQYGEDYLRYAAQVPRWLPARRLPIGMGEGNWIAITMHQSLNLLVLVPFIAKELNLFGLWLHP